MCRHAPWLENTFIHDFGWLGVDVFFGISGFLISGLLLNELQYNGEIKLSRFYKRRILKIVPSFICLLLITPIVNWEGYKAILTEIFMLQAYLPHNWGHTWSISVEEHFYIFFPLVLVYYFKKSTDFKRRLTSLAIVLAIIAFLILTYRIINLYYLNPHITRLTHTNPTHLRADSLIYGILAQVFTRLGTSKGIFLKILMLISILVYFSINYYFIWQIDGFSNDKSPFNITIGYSIFGIFTMLLIYLYYDITWIPQNAISKIGTYSYNIYLFHLPVLLLVQKIQANDKLLFLLYILFSLLIGGLMTKYIERPFLTLRKKWAP